MNTYSKYIFFLTSLIVSLLSFSQDKSKVKEVFTIEKKLKHDYYSINSIESEITKLYTLQDYFINQKDTNNIINIGLIFCNIFKDNAHLLLSNIKNIVPLIESDTLKFIDEYLYIRGFKTSQLYDKGIMNLEDCIDEYKELMIVAKKYNSKWFEYLYYFIIPQKKHNKNDRESFESKVNEFEILVLKSQLNSNSFCGIMSNDSLTVSKIYGLISRLYIYKNIDYSIDFLKKGRLYNPNSIDCYMADYKIGNHLNNNYLKQNSLLDSIIKISQKHKLEKATLNIYKTKFYLNKDLNNSMALNIVDSFFKLQKIVSNKKNIKNFTLFKIAEKTKQLNHDNKLLEKEINLNQKIIYKNRTIQYLLITVLIISFLTIWLIYKNRNKLIKLKVKNKLLKISDSNRKLVTLSARLNEKDRVINTLKNDLNKIKLYNEDDNLNSYIKEIESKIKDESNNESNWETFKLHFEETHPAFFKKLQSQNTEITNYDLKLASYIKMNLSNKEIAQILSISPKSVTQAKTRLKKKLNLEIKLSLYIRNL